MKYFIVLACIMASCAISGSLKESKPKKVKTSVNQADVRPGPYALLSL